MFIQLLKLVGRVVRLLLFGVHPESQLFKRQREVQRTEPSGEMDRFYEVVASKWT